MNTTLTLEQPLLSMLPGVAVTEVDTDVTETGNNNGDDGGVAVCPSGGLLGRGHAPGASGIAQLVELVWQLRGVAGSRQLSRARTALQHSTALGRAVSLSILQRISP